MQPHRVRYWLNAHPTDPVAFRAEVQTVCQLYEQAPELLAQGVHVISSDEMTGIQAQEAHLSHRDSFLWSKSNGKSLSTFVMAPKV